MVDAPALSPEDEKAKAERAACARRWIAELGVSEKAQSKWLTRARKITKRYKKEGADSEKGDQRKFALLWSNIETLRPAVYSRPPQAVVARRFKDADPTGRVCSEILERSLNYSVDKQDLDGVLRTLNLDFVLIGRGQAWERYVPTYGGEITPTITLQLSTDAATQETSYLDEDGAPYEGEVEGDETAGFTGQGQPFKPVVFEESITDYVNWEDFGCAPVRTWDENDYVWRRVYLDRKGLKERFGDEIGGKVPLDWSPKVSSRASDEESLTKKAAVYEIWCKSERKVYWISKSWSEGPLDERDDPLGLDGFFPCPRPVYGTLANDSLIPVPDYVFYQDQAEEIDDLTARIAELQDALKVRGFYAGDIKTNLNNLLNSKNNTLIPVPEWQTLKDGGGVAGKIEWMPTDLIAKTLQACITLRAQLIEDVYQITGVADILRGASDPRETATAQRIKGQWGPLRIRDRQNDMARFARDVLRIKGEVIAEKFSTDTLKAMTGLQLPTNAEKAAIQQKIAEAQQAAEFAARQAAVMGQAQQPAAPGQPPQQMGHNGGPPMPPENPPEVQEILAKPSWEDVEALLRDNAMRQFRIDIETDSTIEPNESEEKQQTVELVTALGSLISQWGPAVAAQPALAPVAAEIIKYSLRRFRAGRQFEDIIDSALDKIAATPPAQERGQAPPDQTPVQVATIEQQTETIKQQGETQRAEIGAQIKAAEFPLKQGDQQLKLVAMQRDPQPQASA